jgi:Arc/MetJ-type ribon-helix-helix transcriptional regulator
MVHPLPPDIEELIKEQMAAGAYDSEADLIRDALQALDERKSAIIEEDPLVVEGIGRGLADLKQGRFQALDQFDAEFRARHNIPHDAKVQHPS